ncbi:MAG TPA: hypothetical protein VK904_05785, partial [Miltoncostaeaceae bacterium]|nr:hypothetical protein [Miltoncostaeaceae bacterium]
ASRVGDVPLCEPQWTPGPDAFSGTEGAGRGLPAIARRRIGDAMDTGRDIRTSTIEPAVPPAL